MSEKPRNAMQAVLDRAAQSSSPPPSMPVVETPAPQPVRRASRAKASRPSRENTRLIGGHFPPEVSKQLRLIAVEEDTTVQALLEQAIDLLLAKKAKGRLTSRQS